ncbi:MAG: hypothetical protein P8O99_04015 [Pseudomonadales bacterium]|nr:hypothetical protein [Pseudomonadales bacterium]
MNKLTNTIGLLLLALLPLLTVQTVSAADPATVSIVRPSDPMTLTQVVKLTFGKNETVKLRQNKILVIDTVKGKHKVQTKVGLSLAVPNVTGFNGAKKFKTKINLNQDKHFFKVVFKAALMGGKHEVIEIDKAEFDTLAAKVKKD